MAPEHCDIHVRGDPTTGLSVLQRVPSERMCYPSPAAKQPGGGEGGGGEGGGGEGGGGEGRGGEGGGGEGGGSGGPNTTRTCIRMIQ
jgi:hypothetical protein